MLSGAGRQLQESQQIGERLASDLRGSRAETAETRRELMLAAADVQKLTDARDEALSSAHDSCGRDAERAAGPGRCSAGA